MASLRLSVTRVVLFASLAATLARSGSAHAQTEGLECLFQRFLGTIEIDGGVLDLVIKDQYMYAAAGASGLLVFDISDPAQSVLVDNSVNDASIGLVHVSDNRLYAAANVGSVHSLRAYDLTNPTTPQLIGEMAVTQAVRGLTSNKDFIAVTFANQLALIDLSGTSPAQIGSVAMSGPSCVALRGDIAIVGSGCGLHIIDISIPSSPVEVAWVSPLISGDCFGTSGFSYTTDIELMGDHAYMCFRSANSSQGYCYVVDIANPNAPAFLTGFRGFSFGPRSVQAVGDKLFVGTASRGVEAFDITNRESPIYFASLYSDRECRGLESGAEHLYISSEIGITPVNIADLRPGRASNYLPEPTRPPHHQSETHYIAISGHIGALTYGLSRARISGLDILDLSNPAGPQLVARYPGQRLRGVEIRGNHVFAASGEDGLDIIDISDLADPTRVTLFDTPGEANFVFLDGDVAYIADMAAGVHSVDITDPANPQLLGSFNTPGEVWVVRVVDGVAYLADYNVVRMLDVSDPTNMLELGSINVNLAWDLEVVYPYVYLPNGDDGLAVIDVSDPTNPVIVATYDTGGYSHGITHAGSKIYMANHVSLLIFDVTDPLNPTLIGVHDTPGDSEDVTVSNGYAYVPDWRNGLQIFDVGSDCTTPCPADTNNDGTLSPADFSAWIAAFNANAPACDQNADSLCTPADFSAWIANYNAGC